MGPATFSAGKPSAAFDAAGAGNVARSRCCDTRRRKSESTGNTNFDLNRRASLRPYLREAGGAIPSAYSPGGPGVPDFRHSDPRFVRLAEFRLLGLLAPVIASSKL